MLTASPQYVIDILSDMAPTVAISKPGRDTPATPVEEFLDRGQGRRRLRRPQPRAGLLGERRAREEGAALRRREAADRSHRRPHPLPRGAGREGRRRGVLLRAGHRQRRQRRQADAERHLLPAHPAVRQGLQAGHLAGRRRRRGWRRRRGRRPVRAAAPDRRRDLQRPARQEGHGRRQAARGHGGARAVAGAPARTGRGAGGAHGQPPGDAGSVLQEDRRACCRWPPSR